MLRPRASVARWSGKPARRRRTPRWSCRSIHQRRLVCVTPAILYVGLYVRMVHLLTGRRIVDASRDRAVPPYSSLGKWARVLSSKSLMRLDLRSKSI